MTTVDELLDELHDRLGEGDDFDGPVTLLVRPGLSTVILADRPLGDDIPFSAPTLLAALQAAAAYVAANQGGFNLDFGGDA